MSMRREYYYSRTYGVAAGAEKPYISSPRPQEKIESEPGPTRRKRGSRHEIASVEKSVGALISFLHDEPLPLDVSRYLLDENARDDAVAQVMRALIRNPDYTETDMVHAEVAFNDLRSVVIESIKQE